MDFEMDGIFDRYERLNRWQAMTGTRINRSGTKPSVYISEIKLKKAFKEMKDEHVVELYGEKAAPLAPSRLRRRLNNKLQELLEWQLFRAVDIYLERGAYDAAQYVILCRYDDKQEPGNEEEN